MAVRAWHTICKEDRELAEHDRKFQAAAGDLLALAILHVPPTNCSCVALN